MNYIVDYDGTWGEPKEYQAAVDTASEYNRRTGYECKVFKIVEVACYPAKHNKDSNEDSN